MKAANLYLGPKNVGSENLLYCRSHIQFNDDDEKEFQERCLRELKSMKSKKIVNSGVSFYDILVKGESSLAACMRNENIVELSKTANYEMQFPLYSSILKSHFRMGAERNELLETANRNFNYLFKSLTELPYVCSEKILSYLTNEDLKSFIDVFELHCDS